MKMGLRALAVSVLAIATILGGVALSGREVSAQTRQGTAPGLQQTRSPVVSNPTASSQSACPEVTSLNPASLSQGQTATVTLTGRNLTYLKSVTLPGQGVTVTSLTVAGPSTAQVSVTAAPDAAAGPRPILLTGSPQTLGAVGLDCGTREARPRLMVTPKATEQLTVVTAPMPDVVAITPGTVTRGDTTAVTLRVSNFSSRTTVDFGKGLESAGSLTRSGEVSVTATIRIASDAAMGKRDILVQDGNRSRTATASLVVVDKPSLSDVAKRTVVLPLVSLSVDSVTPPTWVAGNTYKIALQGKGFATDMEVDFGEGVKTKGKILVVNDSLAQAEVTLSDTIPSQYFGERHPKARVGQNAPLQGQPATIVVYPLTKTTSGEWTPPKGKITLVNPEYGRAGIEFPEYRGAPLLHEGLVFKWKEEQPSLATYFELRILSKDGKTVLKKAITQVPVYEVPEEFIYEFLMDGTSPGPLSVAPAAQKSPSAQKQGQSGSGQQQAQSQGLTYPPETDYLWEVAGYKVINLSNGKITSYTGTLKGLSFPDLSSSGSGDGQGQAKAAPATQTSSLKIARSPADVKSMVDAAKAGPAQVPAQTIAVEVEISERWPLSRPDKPTGLACPAQGLKKGNVNTIAFNPIGEKCVIDPTTRKCKIVNGQKVIDQSNYPGDRFRLGGSFAIVKAPYDLETSNDTLYNVVVDWGDPYPSDTPAVVTNLKVKAESTKHTSYDKEGANYGDIYTKTYTLPDLEHAYSHYGNYHVRVYLLPDDKLQSTDPDDIARAFDKDHGSSQSPYEKIMASMTPRGNTGQSVRKEKNQDVGKYAYMIYCNSVDIRQVEDIDATGPLHLDKIEVTGFPGHDPGQAESCKAGGTQKASAQPVTSQKSVSAAGKALKKDGPKANSQLAQVPAMTGKQTGPLPVVEVKPTGLATECDESLVAEGKMSYYGTGYAAVRWKRNDVTVRYEEHFVPPSQSRQNLDRDPAKWPPVIVSTDAAIPNSGNLLAADKTLGSYLVHVEAMVLPKATPVTFGVAMAKAIDDPKAAARMSAILGGGSGAGSGPKFGYLPVNRKAAPGVQPVAYVNDYLKNFSQKGSGVNSALAPVFKPDVFSERAPYKIVAGDPSQLCTLKFPSANGDVFVLSGLQGNYVKNGDKYSGCGTMTVRLNTSVSGSPEEMPVVVKFQDWQAPDSANVKAGTLDVAPQKQVKVPGATGVLERVTGKVVGGAAVGSGVEATMTLTLSDSLRMEGAEKPQEFKSVKAPLSAKGDWYVEKQSLKPTLIGWSAFKIKSDAVTFDFSKTKSPGSVSGACKGGGGSNPGWMGIHLGSATLIPYTFEQTGQGGWTLPTVTDWAIEDQGICGTKQTGSFATNIYDGSIKFDSIDVTSQNGVFDATYKNMVVHIPWLNTDLKGSTKLHWQGGGEKGLMFYLAGDPPPRDYGVVKMQVKNVIFTQEENVGWTSRGDGKFDFFADGKSFDSFSVPNLFFDFAGKAYFEKGATTKSLPRNGSVKLSQTPLNLANVTLDTKATGENRLKFTFGAKVHLSKVMPLIDVPVTFAINRQGQDYKGWGPKVAPFTVNLGFPETAPTVNAAMSPEWTGSPAGKATAMNDVANGNVIVSDALTPGADLWKEGELYAANLPGVQANPALTRDPVYQQVADGGGGGDGDQFKGSLDLGMFGGPPIKAEFRLGYKGGGDYWITRATVPLGSSGIGLVPPYVFLYAIRGGLAYNFPIDAFKKDIFSAVPDMSGTYMFMAGMRVGSPDQFAYMMDGDFSVNTAAQARMDYRAWLLSSTQEGQGNFWGFFQYAEGSFDGALQGKIGFLGDLVYMEIPENAATLHFGNDYWHIAAGKREGPRIKAHLIFQDSDSYFEIGSKGVAFGGGQGFNMNGGIGKISGYLEMGILAVPGPKITGSASGGLSADVCAFGECIGASIDASVVISAPPASAKCHACVTIPIPFWNPSACGDFSL
jgi:hypothetical protein